MAGIAERTSWRLIFAGLTGAVLLLPAITTLLSIGGMDWGAEDFIAAAVLIAATWAAVEAVLLVVKPAMARALAIGAVVAVTLGLWAQLAVGIF